jgi:hypothetical protein
MGCGNYSGTRGKRRIKGLPYTPLILAEVVFYVYVIDFEELSLMNS